MAKQKALSGLEKAAIFLITIGPELSSLILKQMAQEDIERITYQIANTTSIDPATMQQIVDEFLQLSDAHTFILQGGMKYAREVLEKTLGPARASEIIKKLMATSKIRPFNMIRKADPKQLVNFIYNEHPQTIALILAYLEPEQAAIVLGALPDQVQADVAKRIALMERASPETLRELESIMEQRLSSLVEQDFAVAGGLKSLVDILNRADRSTERTILEALEQDDPELADEIRKRMFVFEDILTLDDTSIRRVLREVDLKDLALALKAASEEVANRIYRNLSKRAGEMLREDIEYMGPARLRDVEEAQQRIVQIIRRLDEAGEIIIARGGEDAIVV
ncbi:flagellar motor switch protein FliG [Moorella sp. E308F]|uniref:flagellar motor switch protein FliG n=1 Tax=unclassified Neomoorella TaxID=2676739 RepID=UPI0010FFAE24|nr:MULTISPECIES: flagellar motor switch protein FliG [unclassified Moorella (in: firmicutes)]MDK2895480.1 flagellar motor switch protein FliG [Moorella sp. (in: firmicutes)]GEA16647.1 flagellar motor switch protein FliG [Moorella sp. E308F]GEA17164.1 flagellar motor switch protein FliG [Moorella sp. E306M]